MSIRNKIGEEKMRIERTANGSQSGIWALAWNPSPEDGHDILCVADWAQTISFYSLSGKQVRYTAIPVRNGTLTKLAP